MDIFGIRASLDKLEVSRPLTPGEEALRATIDYTLAPSVRLPRSINDAFQGHEFACGEIQDAIENAWNDERAYLGR